jgi:N-succinyldiaminopimelate aminotransferase
MPRPPAVAAATGEIPGAVFSPIADKMRAAPGGVCPLHVGDTWLPPLAGGRMEDLREADYPDLHRYCETRGLPRLIDALVEKLRSVNGLACERDNVLVTGGATAGLGAALASVADPGDEVLILAPFWPLIRGVVQTYRATPVEVPFYDVVASAEEAVAAVRANATERSVALYVSTPSNPTGRIIPQEWLEALAAWASDAGVWLISDEVYEDYVYRGEHASLARFAPERTLSAFSFSKAYGMAGNRTGYLVGPPDVIAQAQKVSTHTAYHAPTAGQLAALRALEEGRSWVERARQIYREVGDATAARLGIPEPQGGQFHFLYVGPHLDERGIWGFLSDCVDDGFALAPGPSCGRDYEGWARLCFTAAPPEAVLAAVDRLALRLAARG